MRRAGVIVQSGIFAIAVAACSPSPPASASQGQPPAATPAAPPASTTLPTQSATAPPPTPKPLPGLQRPPASLPSNAVSASRADVRAREDRTVTMKVGQTLGMTMPAGAAVLWQVDYDADRLQPLTPKEKMTQPGEAGWVFRAIKPGDVEISMTGRAPCATPPCESNPPKLTFSVQITDRF